MYASNSLDCTQVAQWPQSDVSSSVSPSDLDMMANNPFDTTAVQGPMVTTQSTINGQFDPFSLFDHAAYVSGVAGVPNSMHNIEHGSPNVDWNAINSARGSFSSISTDGSMLEQPSLLGEFNPYMEVPKRRRRRHLDPEVRHTEKLEKNRRAAERCRQKQRMYVGALQERAREEELRRARLVAQVNQLRDAILSLKESMVSHSGCPDERIRQYLMMELGKSAERRMSENTGPSTMTSTPVVTPGGFQYPLGGPVMPLG